MTTGIPVYLSLQEWTALVVLADNRVKDLMISRRDPADPKERAFLSDVIRKLIGSVEEELETLRASMPEDEHSERPYATPWWDRAELANWRMDSSTLSTVVTMFHMPCGQSSLYHAHLLTGAIRFAAEHKCPRDYRPPADDNAAVTDWVERKNSEDDCGTGPHPVGMTRG